MIFVLDRKVTWSAHNELVDSKSCTRLNIFLCRTGHGGRVLLRSQRSLLLPFVLWEYARRVRSSLPSLKVIVEVRGQRLPEKENMQVQYLDASLLCSYDGDYVLTLATTAVVTTHVTASQCHHYHQQGFINSRSNQMSSNLDYVPFMWLHKEGSPFVVDAFFELLLPYDSYKIKFISFKHVMLWVLENMHSWNQYQNQVLEHFHPFLNLVSCLCGKYLRESMALENLGFELCHVCFDLEFPVNGITE